MNDELENIKGWIYKLVELQENFNAKYATRLHNNDLEQIREDLLEEKDILRIIFSEINTYFGYEPYPTFKLPWNHFRLNQDPDYMSIGRWEINPPWFFDKSTVKFAQFKEMMVKLHKNIFLNGDMIKYVYTRVENHIWELPCFIKDDEFIRRIRRNPYEKIRC